MIFGAPLLVHKRVECEDLDSELRDQPTYMTYQKIRTT